MKKIFTILSLTVLITNTSLAQQFGIKAGLDLTNLSVSSEDTSLTFDMGTAYSAGIFGIFELSDVLQLRPELLYAHRNASTSLDFLGLTIKSIWKMDYIELPINLSYMASEQFSVNAGPYVGLLLSAKATIEGLGTSEETDIKESTSSMDYGVNLGVSYHINENIMINAGYTLGLANLIDDDTDDTLKSSAIRLSFGYVLGSRY